MSNIHKSRERRIEPHWPVTQQRPQRGLSRGHGRGREWGRRARHGPGRWRVPVGTARRRGLRDGTCPRVPVSGRPGASAQKEGGQAVPRAWDQGAGTSMALSFKSSPGDHIFPHLGAGSLPPAGRGSSRAGGGVTSGTPAGGRDTPASVPFQLLSMGWPPHDSPARQAGRGGVRAAPKPGGGSSPPLLPHQPPAPQPPASAQSVTSPALGSWASPSSWGAIQDTAAVSPLRPRLVSALAGRGPTLSSRAGKGSLDLGLGTRAWSWGQNRRAGAGCRVGR